jgi:HK97 family phage prohead protease
MEKPKYDFGGWATRFNIKCSDGRTICKEAFLDNNGTTVPLVWNHGHDNVDNILGHALLENREDGVYAYCSFNDTEQGNKAKEIVKHHDICALSIYANRLKENSNKEVTHGQIREVSLVLAGANPGAYINNIVMHSDNGEIIKDESGEAVKNKEEAEIFNPSSPDGIEINLDNDESMEHSSDNEKEKKMAEEKTDPSNKDDQKKDETMKEVFNTLTDKQKTVVYAIIGQAVEDAKKELLDNKEQKEMKHNAFDSKSDEESVNNTTENNAELMHSEIIEAIHDVTETKKYGSMKESFIQHGITGLESLLPEVKSVSAMPKTVDNDTNWVNVIMSGIVHTPFSRVKSTYATLTAEDARARGYVKGKQKVEEVIAAAKRSTFPQTVYKLQKLDRDDVIDITDFDVIAWIKQEMRGKLEQELARAILVGDNRPDSSDDKINAINIRPIASDDSVYTTVREIGKSTDTVANIVASLIDDSVISMNDYKGTGNITAFVRQDVRSQMLLLKDTTGRRIYKDDKELAAAMLVNKIVPVPSNIMGDHYMISIDLSDYNVGADKGGAVNFFDDFDINYNKLEYLIETRCSGANVTPYSAIVYNKPATTTQG